MKQSGIISTGNISLPKSLIFSWFEQFQLEIFHEQVATIPV